jgi:NAD(P)-dependent dehydrogenase (short-subunit alcohol dehydrogenase family)
MERPRITVLTGGASGIGSAVRRHLAALGGQVLVIDRQPCEVVADLSVEEGRIAAAAAVADRFPEGVDSVICCAGIGGSAQLGAQTTAINFFATTRFLQRLRPLLAKGREPRAVVTSSSMSLHAPDELLLQLMMADDEERSKAYTNDTMVSYITGKRALCHWVRRHAPRTEWAGAGILLNGIAPGLIRTPLTSGTLDRPEGQQSAGRLTPLALAEYPGPEAIAPLMSFLASPANAYLVGQIIYADGGSDVLLRGEAVP